MSSDHYITPWLKHHLQSVPSRRMFLFTCKFPKLTAGLTIGLTLARMAKFDFVKVLEYTQKYRITFLVLVPPVVVAMAKSPIALQYDLSSVERIVSGAAPLGREVCAELENRIWPNGQVNIKQGWGMTEITCSAMGWHPQEKSYAFSVRQQGKDAWQSSLMDSRLAS
jgi:acyl-coenzyme A synthetase/AMP-(fatty) acid ligase